MKAAVRMAGSRVALVCYVKLLILFCELLSQAAIAQLGERQTEDLKVLGSIPGLGKIARTV